MPLEEFLEIRNAGLVNLPAETTKMSLPTTTSRGARLATSLFFLSDGMIFGTWATLIPSFKTRFGLSEGSLSIILLAMVFGALASMPTAGQLIARHGSKACLYILGPGFCAALVLLGIAPGLIALIAAAFIFGAFKGALDVSVNAQSLAVESAAGKPIVATFHALWSIGGLLAALLVGIALKQNITPLAIILTVSVGLGIVVISSASSLLSGDHSGENSAATKFKLPRGRLLRIGILACMALFAEGVMMDWSAVYARTVSGAEEWLAPIAYGVFCCSMATGRLTGDMLTSKLGASTVLRLGGVLTTVGLVVIVLFHHWIATFAGLALAGIGLSNLVPILFSAGGRAHNGGVGKGIATVSMMGYFGFLVGPPVIGGASHFIGLPGAFTLVALFSGFIALRGNRLLNHSNP